LHFTVSPSTINCSNAASLQHSIALPAIDSRHRVVSQTMKSDYRPPICFLLICFMALTTWSNAEEVKGAENVSSSDNNTEEKKEKKTKSTFDATNMNWGSYYDPQNIFCGKYDCYKILGFDYESFGKIHPDTKEITQRYRKLSRQWHPDKNKHRDAKDRFVKISRAYEVLTTKELRDEYDHLRYNQDAYFEKYGTSVLWSYAPKTDVTIVVLLILIIGNAFSWYSQKHRWQMVADRLTKAAIEDWSPMQGGTPESKQLREEALAILAEREQSSTDEANDVNSSSASKAASKKKAKGAKKLTGKEKKQQEQDTLLPIIKELVNEMKDFGGGFHQPTWRDLMIVALARLPYRIATGTLWQMKYWIRRLRKKELNDEEREVLTSRAVGPVVWDTASESDRKEMMDKELWVIENLVEWNEEQEFKKLSASEQKMYLKMKKKGKLDKIE
jgi:DnaJ homolog subfamily C member 25